jgi:farnesyl-diphosphate farnesyltransferase
MNKKLFEILKNTSRSLYLSFKVMPKGCRELFAVAYLLCRAADTITDTPLICREAKLPAIKKFPKIVASPDENMGFADELAQKITTPIKPAHRQTTLPLTATSWHLSRKGRGNEGKLEHERILIEALPDILKTVSQFGKKEKELINFVVSKVCKGMETDLTYFGKTEGIKAFETSMQLATYCRYIGGEPGAFWAKSFLLGKKFKPEKAKKFTAFATNIGDALQITNILRDIPQDLKNARCYLPAEDLKEVNLTPEDLSNPSSVEKLKPVIKKQIKWAIARLDCGEEFISLIPKKDFLFKAATIWPIYWCLDTLQQIYNSDELLKPGFKAKITKTSIYLTILKTPPALVSNQYFNRGFRLRRKALSSMLG